MFKNLTHYHVSTSTVSKASVGAFDTVKIKLHTRPVAALTHALTAVGVRTVDLPNVGTPTISIADS